MKIKLTKELSRIPTKTNSRDAGFDLYSPVNVIVPSKGKVFVNFGVCIKLPVGKAGFIFARSGLGSKKGIVPENCVGVIDEKYYQELGMMVQNKGDKPYEIKIGDRIAQLVIMPVEHPELEVVEDFDTTGSRDGGFGNSGR